MTEEIARHESWLAYLKSIRENTRRQIDTLTSHLARLDTLIEREQTSPTPLPSTAVPSPNPASSYPASDAQAAAPDPQPAWPAPPQASGAYAQVPPGDQDQAEAATANQSGQPAGQAGPENGAKPWA